MIRIKIQSSFMWRSKNSFFLKFLFNIKILQLFIFQIDQFKNSIMALGIDFHGLPLRISWLVIANIAVMVATFRWSKYSYYIHLFFALVIIGLTLLSTITLLQNWLPKANVVKANESFQKKFQRIHNYVGLILVCWLGLQIITGFISRFARQSIKISPNICIWTRRIHIISSYLIMLMSKYNYIGIAIKQHEIGIFVILLIIDVICIIIYLILKFKYYTFSEIITNYEEISSHTTKKGWLSSFLLKIKQTFKPKSALKYHKEQLDVQIYQSEDQISLKRYVLFNDYVYDTEPLKNLHPGGQYLIKHTNKRQIDRFIYGASPFELMPEVKVHSHTKDSLSICGPPIAKIERESSMKKMSQLSKVSLIKCGKLASKSSTYVLHFRMGSQKQRQGTTTRDLLTQFEGYTSTRQFGQYFTLSLIKKKDKVACTRLYTTIWCMRPQNIEFMERSFSSFLQDKVSNATLQTEVEMYGQKNKNQVIPLVIKKYQKGQFTSQLLKKDKKVQCIISKPMGKGLDYNKLKSDGKVIFVSGGTGILPFCDFIDILFKRVKFVQKTNISDILIERDPIVKENIILNRKFVIYHAAEYVDDIPSLTLFQISELCKSQQIDFKAVLRISKDPQSIPEVYRKNIQITKEYFNETIKKQHLSSLEQICKIFICGSKQLNYQIGKLLVDLKVDEQLYHFM